MKTQRKPKKSMTFLKVIVAVLFAALLFTPENSNRLLIAGVAIIGMIGTLLLLIAPMLPRIRLPRFSQKIRITGDSKPEHLSETETLLWRQISYQITDKLKAAFPNATWEFVKRPKMNDLLNGNTIRIRTKNTGDYNFAEFHLNQYGYLALELLTVESLKKQPVKNSNEESEQVDPQSWYSLIGKPLLIELIGDLQARGHQKLFINEAGEIFIRNGNTPEVKGCFENFPPKSYWPILADIFIQDELDAKELDHELELSWNA